MSIDKVINATVGPAATGQLPQRAAGNIPSAAAVTAAPSIEAVAERLETYLKSVGRALEFHVDAASGRTVLSVRDAQTGDLIRQIPGEEALRLAQMAADQTIVLVSERV